MLLLVVRAADVRCGLPANRVLRVTARPTLEPAPHAPVAVVGFMRRHEALVPVVDFSQVLRGKPAEDTLAARVVLLEHGDGDGPSLTPLGLLVDEIEGVVSVEEGQFQTTGLEGRCAPFLGPVVQTPDGFLQWVEVSRILPTAAPPRLEPLT
ncbi:MAG TPA: chemotaxis protein CheW [Pirellulales bacterium]